MAGHLRLYGPDKQGVIYRIDGVTQARIPVFGAAVQSSKPQVRIAKILPNGHHEPLGTASTSSLSGSTTFTIRGKEIKMVVKSESLQPKQAFSLPNMPGEWKWQSDKHGFAEDLVDAAGVTVAHASWYKSPATVDIFVPVGDWLVEFIVLSALAVMAGDKKGLKIVSELIGAF